MKLVVSRGIDDPRLLSVDRGDDRLDVAWISAHWAPTKEEIRPRLCGLFKSYHAPTREQFAELVTSFIPSGSIVYARFVSFTGEIPFIIQDMDRLGLRHEPPLSKRDVDAVLGEVHKDFVFEAFKHNSGWESSNWDLLIASRRIDGWVDQLEQVSSRRIVTRNVLDEASLFLTNAWEHGVEVLSNEMYFSLEERAVRIAKLLKWEFERVY